MGIGESVREALGTVRAYPLRAFFIVFGTLTGVAFLVAVVTILEGMNGYVETNVVGRFLGHNTASLRREAPAALATAQDERRARSRRGPLTLADAEWLEARMRTPGVISAEWSASAPAATPEGRRVDRVMLTGATASHFHVRSLRVEHGRPFSPHEADRGLPVAVIGRDVANRLFPGTGAVGRRVTLGGVPYRVVGVLAPQGKLFTLSLDNVAVVPARSRLNGVVTARDVVDVIAYKVPESAMLPLAVAELEGWMRLRKRLRPADENEFSVVTAEHAMAGWGKISRVMMVAVPGLIGISLLVAAAVIMNIMLVSVTERTYEIGLRKALGARARDIRLLFLVESATLSGAGGVLGVGAGFTLAGLVAALTPLPAQVAPWSAGLGLLLGVGVGVVAGVYPASRAARLDPIVALGHE